MKITTVEQLIKEYPDLCREMLVEYRDAEGCQYPDNDNFQESWEYFTEVYQTRKSVNAKRISEILNRRRF